jgi:hypothetical protein
MNQTIFTNAVIIALAVMAIIYASYPPKTKNQWILMIVGVIAVGALYIILVTTLPSG